MRIILAPAKKMREDLDSLAYRHLPDFLEDTKILLDWLRGLSYDQAKALWACNHKIAAQNYERVVSMELNARLTPAILAYQGIAYQYMAPAVFADHQFDYVQAHLRILSGFYGVLRPMDGVTPYRLEMQARAAVNGARDLYEYWGDKLYRAVLDDSRVIVNLASKEYSRCIEPYLTPADTYLTCVFGELTGGRVVQKGVYAKMARGEMVRYMAERQIEDPEKMRGFDRLGYRFSEELSSEAKYVFLRGPC